MRACLFSKSREPLLGFSKGSFKGYYKGTYREPLLGFSKGSFKGYYKGTYRGLKDPIIRHLVLGKQLCRLGFWRVYDY